MIDNCPWRGSAFAAATPTELVYQLVDDWILVVIIGDVMFLLGIAAFLVMIFYRSRVFTLSYAFGLFFSIWIVGSAAIVISPLVREIISVIAGVLPVVLPIFLSGETVQKLMTETNDDSP
jgi:hypothetical protein